MKNPLIYDVLEDIKTTLNNNSILILEAPPDVGKSIIVPIFLLNETPKILNNTILQIHLLSPA